MLFQPLDGPDGSRVSRSIPLAFASAPDLGWLHRAWLGSQTHLNYQTPGSCSIPAGLDHNLLHPEPKGSASRGARDGMSEEPYSKRGRVPGVSVPSQRCQMREMGECHGTHGPVLVMLIYSLVCLCPVVLPKALCILSCPCKPFWREGLAAVLPSVWHCVGPCWNLGSETQPASAGSAVWTGCPWRSTAKLDPTGLIQNPIKSGRK